MSWVKQNNGTTSDLASVYFTDVNTGYVVGGLNTILKTTNGGVWVNEFGFKNIGINIYPNPQQVY